MIIRFKKGVVLFLLLSLFIMTDSKTLEAQIYTGGTMGVNYNNGYIVELAPLLGYKYKIFESGVSPFISYLQSTGKYAFGGRIFSDVTFYKDIFAHAEFEVANTEKIDDNHIERQWVISMPLGAGYRYKLMDGVYAYGMILYNVLHSSDSPTKNPIVRGGITYQP